MGKYLANAFVLRALLLATFAALSPLVIPAQSAGAFDRVVVDGLRLIVIDPGHGGEDTGAKGPTGVLEKDITLNLALKLAEVLKDRLDCRVLLTRTTDVFIPLEDRTAFANRSGADIFVSIHANAAPNRDARGIETFFLSFEATDEDARRVAAFENSAGAAAGSAAAADGGDLRTILLDLASTMSHHESSRLAEAVHMNMLATGRENRGVKQAPFTVLVGATMPAVLVEVGFISNSAEERWLAAGSDQARMAGAIADGILGFRGAVKGRKGYVEVSGKSQED